MLWNALKEPHTQGGLNSKNMVCLITSQLNSQSQGGWVIVAYYTACGVWAAIVACDGGAICSTVVEVSLQVTADKELRFRS